MWLLTSWKKMVLLYIQLLQMEEHNKNVFGLKQFVMVEIVINYVSLLKAKIFFVLLIVDE